MPELFEEQVSRTPDAVAVVYEETQLTYAELNARANQLARYLRRQGVDLDARVGLCLERSLDLVVGMLGVLKAGAAYVPLDPQYPTERLQYMLADANAPVLVTHRALTERLRDYKGATLSPDQQWEEIGHEDEANLTTVTPDPDNVAYVIYTSGSTGRPKGVMVQHRSLLNLICWHREAFGITAGDRATQLASFSFDAAGWEVWPYLSTGAILYLLNQAA